MGPRVHLVRHAQGYHNLKAANHSMLDPILTPHGIQQCQQLAQTFPNILNIDLVVSSPLKRTIQTAMYSFQLPIKEKNLTIIALPELQETSDLPCDTGSSRSELEGDFTKEMEGLGRVNWSLVSDGWNSKTGRWAARSDSIEKRCAVARRWLRNRPEKDIVVVTHGGLLHYLTHDWSDSQRFLGTGWRNTEYRTYTFDPNSDPTVCALVETQESREHRHGFDKNLSEAEIRNLQRTTKFGVQGKSKSDLNLSKHFSFRKSKKALALSAPKDEQSQETPKLPRSQNHKHDDQDSVLWMRSKAGARKVPKREWIGAFDT